MSLTKEDKKEIILLMGEALQELVLPQLGEIKEDISVLKQDVSNIKEDLSDIQRTANRIETLQRSELNRVDNHEMRIGKLEKAIAK